MSTETPLIDITNKATEQLTSLINEHKDEGQLLRIMVMPAQNGGVQYALGIEKEAQQTDICIKVDNIEVLIEKDCVPLVEGAKIDYIDDLMRSGFIISNPNIPSGGGGGCGGAAGTSATTVSSATAVTDRSCFLCASFTAALLSHPPLSLSFPSSLPSSRRPPL